MFEALKDTFLFHVLDCCLVTAYICIFAQILLKKLNNKEVSKEEFFHYFQSGAMGVQTSAFTC